MIIANDKRRKTSVGICLELFPVARAVESRNRWVVRPLQNLHPRFYSK